MDGSISQYIGGSYRNHWPTKKSIQARLKETGWMDVPAESGLD
jgi:hypothetical protein